MTGGSFHCLALPESGDQSTTTENNESSCDIQSVRDLVGVGVQDTSALDDVDDFDNDTSSTESEAPPDINEGSAWYNPWDVVGIVHRHVDATGSDIEDSNTEIDESGVLCMPGLESISQRFGVDGCSESELDWIGCFVYTNVAGSRPESEASESE